MTPQEQIELLRRRIAHREKWLKESHPKWLREISSKVAMHEEMNKKDRAEIARIEKGKGDQ